MKNLFILSTLILSTPLWAQTYIQNARNVNDIAASSYPIAPGVSISPPMWSRNLNNSNTGSSMYGNNNMSSTSQNNISNANSGVVPGAIPLINIPNNGTANISVNVPSDANSPNIKNTQPSPPVEPLVNTEPVTNVTQPIVAIKTASKPSIVTGSISNWNKTTQQDIEAKADIDLQEKYKDFLMQK